MNVVSVASVASGVSLARTRLNTTARLAMIAGCVALLFGCAQTPPPSPTAAPDSSITPTTAAPAPVAALPATKEASAPIAAAPAPSVTRADPRLVATTAALTPDGKSRYECVTGSASAPTRVAIGLPPGSDRICSRFPAMGPCQYERDACRAQGGRVIRFDGVEITKEVEVEYDRQVQRFRLNAG
jgi:hypothetical protein